MSDEQPIDLAKLGEVLQAWDSTDNPAVRKWAREAKDLRREVAELRLKLSQPASGEKQPRSKWLGHALVVLRDHPEWSDRRIAAEVDISPSTLSRSDEFQRLRAASQRVKHPGGFRTDHGIEAVDDGG